MIHVIPGFLGSAEDFASLENSHIHDLKEETPESIAALVGPSDTLLGYSLGGRVALEVAERLKYNFHSLILLAAHPGGLSPEEIQGRRAWEDEVLNRLEAPAEDFLLWWNGLEVFRGDSPLKPRDLSGWKEIFKRYRLSEQRDFRGAMTEHKDKIIYVYGSEDQKYAGIAQKLSHLGIRTKVISGGHRLFQNTEEIKAILAEENL